MVVYSTEGTGHFAATLDCLALNRLIWVSGHLELCLENVLKDKLFTVHC
jgi:hypothetical protein